MNRPVQPFALPKALPPDLRDLLSHWQKLRRGGNAIPFWDDVALTDMREIAPRLMLIDGLAHPDRYRIGVAGSDIVAWYGEGIEGLFAEQIEHHPLFQFFLPQCAVTVERGAGTLHRTKTYARLLLPLWGEGRISMLLGGFAWAA